MHNNGHPIFVQRDRAIEFNRLDPPQVFRFWRGIAGRLVDYASLYHELAAKVAGLLSMTITYA